MKITIEPETKEEEKIRKKEVFERVFEFGLVGRIEPKMRIPLTQKSEIPLCVSHCKDKATLLGRLEELKIVILYGQPIQVEPQKQKK